MVLGCCAEFVMGVAPPKLMVEPVQSRLDIMGMQQERWFAAITSSTISRRWSQIMLVPCSSAEATQIQAAVNDLEQQTVQFSGNQSSRYFRVDRPSDWANAARRN
jgi:hypothetical protein